jgi:hypothetical protein
LKKAHLCIFGDQVVQHVHHDYEQHGGQQIPLSQTPLVVDEIPRHAIQEDLGRGGCEQASDNISPNPSKAQSFHHLQEEGLIN